MPPRIDGYAVSKSPCDRYTVLEFDTELDVDQAIEAHRTALASESNGGQRRILADLTQVDSEAPRGDQFRFCLRIDETGLKGPDRVAGLVLPESHKFDFVEMGLQDLGYTVRHFRSFDNAMKWLLSEEPAI